MIKFYLSTVIIWFIILIITHIIFYKDFKKAQEKIKKGTNDETKNYGFIKSTLLYLLVSFIPVFRLITEITYFVYISNPNKMIKIINERKEEE